MTRRALSDRPLVLLENQGTASMRETVQGSEYVEIQPPSHGGNEPPPDPLAKHKARGLLITYTRPTLNRRTESAYMSIRPVIVSLVYF